MARLWRRLTQLLASWAGALGADPACGANPETDEHEIDADRR
jgi:hypothetical protein